MNLHGDHTVFGRYTVVQRTQPGRNFRIAPFAGIKAPTGDDDKRDAMGVLPHGNAHVLLPGTTLTEKSCITVTLSLYTGVPEKFE